MTSRKRRPKPGQSIAELFPDLVEEWHPTKNGDLTPADVTKGSGRKIWWYKQCTSDGPAHEWQSTVSNRTPPHSQGCSVCKGFTIQIGVNDLASLSPEIAKEWHPTKNGALKPEQVANRSGKKVWWLGTCGHEWETPIGGRTGKGTGCPICAGNLLVRGINDLQTWSPELAKEWHPTKNGDLTPSDVSRSTHKKVWWLGTCGHDWQATIGSRTTMSTGCPVCAGKTVLAGVNDLATTNPDLAAEWHPTRNGNLLPTQVTAASGKKVWWQKRCRLDEAAHEWRSDPAHRSSGRGCAICAGLSVQAGVNDLATTHPDLAAEWHPTRNGDLTPFDVTKGNHRKVWWQKQCVQDSPPHEWTSSTATRTNMSTGCAICSGRQVQIGVNDLKTLRPDLARQWHPEKNSALSPEQITIGSDRRVWWICELGHEWRQRPGLRVSFDLDCPSCSPSGFNPSKDGWFYLLWHEQKQMQQIGITNVPKRRLRDHKRNGWEVIELRGPMPGDLAASSERSALKSLKRRNAQLGQPGSDGKFDGHTESWPTKSLRLNDLAELFDWIRSDEFDGRNFL